MHTQAKRTIVLLVVLSAVLFATGCSGKGDSARGGIGTESDNDTWPVFRGDRNLSGISVSGIPDSPELLWTFETGDEVRSSAVSDGESVFVGSMDGYVYSIGLRDGRLKWKLDTGNSIEASCLILGGAVYVGNYDGEFFSIDAASGTVLWSFKADAKIAGSANRYSDGNGEHVVVGSHDNFLYSLKSEDGSVAWKYEAKNFINGTCSVSGNRIAFGGCDSMIRVLGTDGRPIAEIESGSYIASSVYMDAESIIAGNYSGRLLLANPETGIPVWVFENEGVPFFSSPAVTDKKVFAGSRDNYLRCFDRTDGTLLWKFLTGGQIDSSPVVAGDRIVFGSNDGRLYIVSTVSGKKLWSYNVGTPVVSSPCVVRGVIVTGSEEGSVYAFGRKTDA